MLNSALIEKVRALVKLVNASDEILTLFVKIKNVKTNELEKLFCS